MRWCSKALGVAAAGSGDEDRFSGRASGAGEGSVLKSTLILLLWLALGLGIVILGWKMALRTAAKKDAEEQLEGWEPVSFSENSVPRLG